MAPGDLTLPEVIATMESYAGDYPGRAILGGCMVVTTDPAGASVEKSRPGWDAWGNEAAQPK